jgi:hypothetical protein
MLVYQVAVGKCVRLVAITDVRVVERREIVHRRFGAVLRYIENIIKLRNLVCALDEIDCLFELLSSLGLGEPFVKEIVRFQA